jgi:Putative methyltransferase
VSQGFDFLELGCGFGSTLLALAAANPRSRFTGIDFMPRSPSSPASFRVPTSRRSRRSRTTTPMRCSAGTFFPDGRHTTGRPITNPVELSKAVHAICDDFFTTVLPELVRQGIVVWDRDQAVGNAL